MTQFFVCSKLELHSSFIFNSRSHRMVVNCSRVKLNIVMLALSNRKRNSKHRNVGSGIGMETETFFVIILLCILLTFLLCCSWNVCSSIVKLRRMYYMDGHSILALM